MDVYIWQIFLNCLANIDIEMSIHLRRQASLNTYLCRPKACSFLRPPHNLLSRKKVSLLFTKISTKRTKTTLLDAYVCKVDVPVDHICCIITQSPFAEFICHHYREVHLKASRIEEFNGFIY